MKNKITLLNVITSLILQICTIISGFIIPKIILNYFGSEVNGLISSINQFLSYISLIEGGVTGVITASLYKPLVNKDESKINSIINTANVFYKKVGFIFIVYSLILAIIYPIIFNTGFSYIYVFTLTLILSLSLLIQYMFSLTLKTLLNADKKVYIVSITQTIIIILNVVLVILSVKIYPNIHILKAISGILFVIQPLVFSSFANKNYKLDKSAKIDNELLKNRWNGFAINIAAFIHFSTDVTILTIFTDLQTVSVYSVYSLVTNGLRSIVISISNGINPTIGHALVSGNEQNLKEKLNIYEYIIFMFIYITFTIASLLITPFVMIYTNGVTDANYNQPLFGILLLLSEALYLIKFPHLNLAYSANKFKEITIPAFIEAVINIVTSVILVNKYGLIGITIGTILGMFYRMIFHVAFTKKIIKTYSQYNYYSKLIVFSLISVVYIFICKKIIPLVDYSIISWLWHGILYSILSIFLFVLLSLILYKKELKFLSKYLKKE